MSADNPKDDHSIKFMLDEDTEELYETAPCGYVTTTIDGRIVKLNRTLTDWLGYEREELIQRKRLMDLLTAGGRIFYETHLNLMLRIQSSVDEIALDILRKDGSVLPTLINARQKRNAADEPVVNRFTIFNASERRAYERDLLAARDLLRTTLASIGDAVVATDARGFITLINPVANELTGWPNNAALGRPIEEVLILVREDSGAGIENPITQVLQSGETIGLTNHTVLVSRDGRRISIDDSASPIRDANGEIIGGVLVFRDISERRKVERALKVTHEELAKRADELRRSNDDLSQFAHVASHDLQSPLSTITQYTQLLERRYGNQLADGTELLRYVTDAAKRMRNLIEDLLSYARVSADGPQIAISVDANLQLTTALENLRSAISSSGATVIYDNLPEVLVDATSLVQLFQNLIGNAIYYRSDAPPRIQIMSTDWKDQWLFSCKDNGIGIAPAFQIQIFEPFKRLHGPDRPGSGLGLAVCRKIVERYNGRIWVDSEVNRGSTFFFSLPKPR